MILLIAPLWAMIFFVSLCFCMQRVNDTLTYRVNNYKPKDSKEQGILSSNQSRCGSWWDTVQSLNQQNRQLAWVDQDGKSEEAHVIQKQGHVG